MYIFILLFQFFVQKMLANGGKRVYTVLCKQVCPIWDKKREVRGMQPTKEQLRVLSKNFLFHGLKEETLSSLFSALAAPQIFHKGETVYEPASFHHALALVLEGELRVVSDADGRRRAILNTLAAGDICGVTAVFGEGETFVTEVYATQDAAVLFIGQEQLSAWFSCYPQLAENYIRFLTDRIRFLNRCITTYTGGQADDRLWRFLCDHADADGTVRFSGSLCDLARALDVGRSSLYRSLDRLEAAGRLSREGKRMQIR